MCEHVAAIADEGVMRHARMHMDLRVWEDAGDEEEAMGLLDAVLWRGLR